METIIGKKINMTQIFKDTGEVVPVTIVSVDSPVIEVWLNKEAVIVGRSKGKGFTGVMKRWNFSGTQATRGQSNKPRGAGSIGSQTPGRVYKGKKMAGRHGMKRITLKGIKIVKVDTAKNELYLTGPLPGARNSKIKLSVN